MLNIIAWLVADIIVGIVGAIIGGAVLSIFTSGGQVGYDFNVLSLGSIVTAVIGAIILLGILRLFNRGSVTA